MNEPAAMSGLKSAARLANDLDRALRNKPWLSPLHQRVERRAWQKWHYEVGLMLAVFDKLTDIEYVDDIGMAELRKHAPFAVKKFTGRGVHAVPQHFYGDKALGNVIEGLIDHAHTPLADGWTFDLITNPKCA